MNRRHAQAVAVLLITAASGCALSRSAMPDRTLGPVAVGEVPPLHETINAGLARHDSARAIPPDLKPSPSPMSMPEPAKLAATPPAPSRTLPGPSASPTPEPATLVTEADPSDSQVEPAASDVPPPTTPPDEPELPPVPDEPLTPPEPLPEPALPEPEPLPELTAPPEPEAVPESEAVPEPEPEATSEPVASADAPRDPAISRTSHVADEPAMSHHERPGKPATRIAARVGDTVITLHELEKVVKDRVHAQKQQQEEGQSISRDQVNQIARESLEYLIDRALMVQAARRELTKPKQWEMFKEYVVKEWNDDELPSLIKRAGVHDAYELERVFAERGESLEERRDSFLLNAMAREYAGMKLRNKITEPGLPEVYAYYRENLHSYDQAAQVTWREIFLPIDDQNDRDTSLRRAQDLHQRLGRGDDFAALARQFSRSPKAPEGGLWQTGYESFGSEVVNRALKQLAPGQLSPVLEDPKGFYIIRVEAVREAGPKPFQEVQRSIKLALMSDVSEQAMKEFLNDLYHTIPVSSPLFEGTVTEPKQIRLAREAFARGR